MLWGWRELNPRRPSQNVTGPRFCLKHSAKEAVVPAVFIANKVIDVVDKVMLFIIAS